MPASSANYPSGVITHNVSPPTSITTITADRRSTTDSLGTLGEYSLMDY